MLPRFWRKIKQRYNLIATKCENCGTYYYPPRNLCPKCRRKSKMVEIRLDGRGEVLSYSVIHDVPEYMKEQKPYIIALIKLKEGPVITAQLICDLKEIKRGMKVKAAFRKCGEESPSGIVYYCTKFVPE